MNKNMLDNHVLLTVDNCLDVENKYYNILNRIKKGDTNLEETFINEFMPFIKSVVRKNSFIKYGIESADEFSIALIGFYEAIIYYDLEERKNFFYFAETIMKRKLIDYYRTSEKAKRELPFTYLEKDSLYEKENYLDRFFSQEEIHVNQYKKIELIQEFDNFRKKLKSFGINIHELSNNIPKHSDSKKLVYKIVEILVKNNELIEKVLKTKNIPYYQLSRHIKVSRKTIQKHRKYILSLCIIYSPKKDSKYDYIKSYIDLDL